MKIIYIKLLTACNAGCYMCSYRHSNDSYRLDIEEFKVLVRAAKKGNYDLIRFTGGEPLLHNQLSEFIKIATDAGLKTSLITNGILLDEELPKLITAGLTQLIISIDGYAELNNKMRDSKDLFQKDMNSLKYAKEHGILIRVNTVVGKINYKDLLPLQNILDEMGVDAWEVTPVKLDKQLDYSESQKLELKNIIYSLFNSEKKLKPMGPIWLADEDESKDFFEKNIMPHNKENCNVVESIRYFDAITNRLYTCNMVAHRKMQNYVDVYLKNESSVDFDSKEVLEIVKKYKYEECKNCVGCSTSAVNYKSSKELNY